MIDENENLNEEDVETIESLGIKATAYNNIVDRYFTKFYVDENTDKEQYIFVHTNGIIMCGLGKNNYIVKSNSTIKEVKDLNKFTKVSGKRKHGAHIVMENETILKFVVEEPENILEQSGTSKLIEFNFGPKVKGKLLEFNSTIFTNPEIIKSYPEKYGFICILLLPDPKGIESFKEKLSKMNK